MALRNRELLARNDDDDTLTDWLAGWLITLPVVSCCKLIILQSGKHTTMSVAWFSGWSPKWLQ